MLLPYYTILMLLVPSLWSNSLFPEACIWSTNTHCLLLTQAYYLTYGPRKLDFANEFFSVLDWGQVSRPCKGTLNFQFKKRARACFFIRNAAVTACSLLMCCDLPCQRNWLWMRMLLTSLHFLASCSQVSKRYRAALEGDLGTILGVYNLPYNAF